MGSPRLLNCKVLGYGRPAPNVDACVGGFKDAFFRKPRVAEV
jgi:hypothetical protein